MKSVSQILVLLSAVLLSACSTTSKKEQGLNPQTTLEDRVQTLESQVQFLQFEVSSWREAMARQGFYVIRAGDTGAKIAKAFGLTLDALITLNPDVEWNRLKVGMVVRVKDNKPANQALVPTPMSVTPPAGQEARQP